APLRADGAGVAGYRPLAEPAREELLRPTVAPRDVDVADARRTRRVEEVGAAGPERFRRAHPGQVVVAAEVDAAGPSDGGEAEAETRDGETRRAERRGRHHSALRAEAGAPEQVDESRPVEDEFAAALQEPERRRVADVHADQLAEGEATPFLRAEPAWDDDGRGADRLRERLDDERVEPADRSADQPHDEEHLDDAEEP